MLESLVLGVHLYTAHFGSHDVPPALRTTDSTPGLYVRTQSGLTAGLVRNSLRRPSLYVAQTWTTSDERWSLTAGVITGYQYSKVTGQRACFEGRVHTACEPCSWKHGSTNAVLRPLIAPSWRGPDVAGFRPRVALLGKALSISIEKALP